MRKIALGLAAALIGTTAYAAQVPTDSNRTSGSDRSSASAEMGAGHKATDKDHSQRTISGREQVRAKDRTETHSRTTGSIRVGIHARDDSDVAVHHRTVRRVHDEPTTVVHRRTVRHDEEPTIVHRRVVHRHKPGYKVVIRHRKHYVEEPGVTVRRRHVVHYKSEPSASVTHRRTVHRYESGPRVSVKARASIRHSEGANMSVEHRSTERSRDVNVSSRHPRSGADVTGSVSGNAKVEGSSDVKRSPGNGMHPGRDSGPKGGNTNQ